MKLIREIKCEEYIKRFQEIKEIPLSNKTAISGFNLVRDIVITLDKDIIEEISRTSKELAAIIINELKNEEDVEIPIENRQIHQKIKDFVKSKDHEMRCGGNAYYGYIVMKHIFHNAFLYYDGHIYEEKEFRDVNCRENIVLKYLKGTRIRDHVISKDSRLILSDRTKHESLLISPKVNADFYFLTGYHHIKNQREIDKIKRNIISIGGYKHTEMSEFTYEKLGEQIISNIYRSFDSIGMNQVEAEKYFGINIEEIKIEDSYNLSKTLPNTLVMIHSPDVFAVFVPKNQPTNSIIDAVLFSQKIGIIKGTKDPYLENVSKHISGAIEIIEEIPCEPAKEYITPHHTIFLIPTLKASRLEYPTGMGDVISASFASYLFVRM